MTKMGVGGLLVGAMMLSLSPIATAAPPNFPDLSGYQQVNADDYGSEFGYATGGVRFSTPDGLHCSLSRNVRGSESVARCRGDLPGTGGATGVLASTYVPTTWQQVDLSKPEMYLAMGGNGFVDMPVNPAAFHPLPAGSRIVYQDITCGVDDAQMTACIITPTAETLSEHGFVLKPDGSSTF